MQSRAVRASPQDRAVALCWALHIGGDMHQPLHRGHRLDWSWLKTDRAGTIAFVRRAPGQTAMDLHQLWDGAFDPTGTDGGDEDGDVDRLRIAFMPRANSIGSAGSFQDWISESETLARNLAYTGPALTATPTVVDAPTHCRAPRHRGRGPDRRDNEGAAVKRHTVSRLTATKRRS